MSDTTLRASIYTMLSSVSGTGMVYDSEQPCADETFINAFQNGAGGAYFGWDLTRVAVKVEYLNHRYQWTHTYRMRGFYGLKSIALSEKAFQAVVDAVLTEFTQNQISGTVRKTFAHADKVIPLPRFSTLPFTMLRSPSRPRRRLIHRMCPPAFRLRPSTCSTSSSPKTRP